MAFGLFKKHNNKPYEKSTAETGAEKKQAYEVNKVKEEPKKNGFTMKTNMEAEIYIRQKFDVWDNSPLKILHNMLMGKSEFKPMEYMWKALIDTNLLLNEIGKDTFPRYADYDENQKNFTDFIKSLEKAAVKIITELLQNSIEGSLDDFTKGMDKTELGRTVGEVSSFSSYDKWKSSCDSKSRERKGESVDSRVFLKISRDKLHVWLMVIPPVNGGKDITEEKICECLDGNNVKSGVNRPLITALAARKKYLKIFEIARGKEVKHGKDGEIMDMFPRDNRIKFREDENGVVNFKELNNIRSVHRDDVICEIVYPVAGEDGMTVEGRKIPAKRGLSPKIPSGKNTVFSEDKTLILAEKNGELNFRDGVFSVNELLTIEHDVDNTVGNIHFTGNVLVKGDVREGFSVTAEGNITIMGACEGAYIEAGGDVELVHGMTGGGKGVIKAGRNIECIFLENCNVTAKGNIHADLLMYSHVSCTGTVTVTGKQGTIMGGSLIAGKGINADIIGAADNPALKTDIVLGASPKLIKEHLDTTRELKEINDKLFKTEQDISYIEKNIDRMSESRVAKLDQLKVQRKFTQMQKEKLEETLGKQSVQLEISKSSCFLTCRQLNPPVNLRVGESSSVVSEPIREAKIYVKEDMAVISGSNLAENIEF